MEHKKKEHKHEMHHEHHEKKGHGKIAIKAKIANKGHHHSKKK